jgi:histidine ammonia-lyase
MTTLILGSAPLTLPQLRAVLDGPVTVELAPAAWACVEKSAATVAAIVAEGRTVYGVNTGFGLLANTSIAPGDLETLQKNLALKAMSLARGASGVRPEIIETLIALLEHDMLPDVPAQGSVGASGDLAPLAHLSLVLVGEGRPPMPRACDATEMRRCWPSAGCRRCSAPRRGWRC